MSVLKKALFTFAIFGLVAVGYTTDAYSFCVLNDSGHTIHVGDFAVPNKKSLDNGDIGPGQVACKDGSKLSLVEHPLTRGVVAIQDQGNTYECEVSPDGEIRFDGNKCYSRRGGYDFLNRGPSVEYDMN